MLQELLNSQLHVAAGTVLLWIAIGGLLGALLGFIAHRVSSKAGAYRLEPAALRWPRIASAAWLLLAGLSLGGSMGGCEGTLRGVEKVVRESQFRKEALDRAAAFGAAGMVWLDLHLQGTEGSAPATLTQDRPIDIRAFLGRLERAEARIVKEALPKCMEYLRTKVDLPKSGLVASMAEASMEFAIRKVLRDKVKEQFVSRGVPIDDFFATLPDRMTFRQLSGHIAEKALVPIFVSPARAWTRGHQLILGVLLVLALALPALAFSIARRKLRPT